MQEDQSKFIEMKLEALKKRTPGFLNWEEKVKSAVLIPLLSREEGYTVLFEMRAKSLRKQPGEICFPGGGIEAGEEPMPAVIRETKEELCISEDSIEIIAPMDILMHAGNSIIYPFLGVLKEYPNTYSSQEVDHVFEVPLAFFLENEPKAYEYTTRTVTEEDFPWHLVPGGKNYLWRESRHTVYFYQYQKYVIWGLTAQIMKAASFFLK